MEKILITGINGFLGSRIAKHLNKKYFLLSPPRALLDITDRNGVLYYMEKTKPDIVIHCAAISDTGYCEKNEPTAYAVNVKGACNVAKGCAVCGAKLIFCSSDQIYNGNTGSSPHQEKDAVMPKTVYGRQKLEAEQSCISLNNNTVSLRLNWMYDCKSEKSDEHPNLFRTIMENIRTQKTLVFPIYDYRGVSYANDVVQAMEQALDLPAGSYNFGSENENMHSMYEFIRSMLPQIEKILGLPKINLRQDKNSFAASARNLCMDISKLRKHGINIQNMAKGFKDCLLIYKELQNKNKVG